MNKNAHFFLSVLSVAFATCNAKTMQLRGSPAADTRELSSSPFDFSSPDGLCVAYPDFEVTPSEPENQFPEENCGLVVPPGGEVLLSEDVVGCQSSIIFELGANATVDCNSFSIIGNLNIGYQIGIWMGQGASVLNCRMKDLALGIYINNPDSSAPAGPINTISNVQIINGGLGINAQDSLRIENVIISRSTRTGLTISGRNQFTGDSIPGFQVELQGLSVCNSAEDDIHISQVNQLTGSQIQARNTDISTDSGEPHGLSIRDCDECLYADTQDTTASPTDSPTAAPTASYQRVRIRAGQDSNLYMSVSTEGVCNRYIIYNPMIVTAPERFGDDEAGQGRNGAPSQIFRVYSNGLIESEACRGTYVSIARKNPGTSCCTPDDDFRQTVVSSCEEGRIRLGTSLPFGNRDSFAPYWNIFQTRDATNSNGNIPYYVIQSSVCPTSRALNHAESTSTDVILANFGTSTSTNGFGTLEWGFELVD